MEVKHISINSDHEIKRVVAICRNTLYFHHLSVSRRISLFVCLSVCYQDGEKTVTPTLSLSRVSAAP